jgi:hypothetical protein
VGDGDLALLDVLHEDLLQLPGRRVDDSAQGDPGEPVRQVAAQPLQDAVGDVVGYQRGGGEQDGPQQVEAQGRQTQGEEPLGGQAAVDQAGQDAGAQAVGDDPRDHA